jgi:uncharacterized membrane protein
MGARSFFTGEQQQTIKNAIIAAELNTSGEIRVHIDTECKGDVLARAAIVFSDLNMDKTDLRNGVLFYLAVSDKLFAILGDKGINEKVPVDFWDNIRDVMLEHFKKDEFTQGLKKGIEMAGEKLITHFPYHREDINELENEITFGN